MRIRFSEAIWTLYKKAALGENLDQDCVEVFNEAKLAFSLYLDAKNAVVAREVGLRHAPQACGTTLYLSGKNTEIAGRQQGINRCADHRTQRPASCPAALVGARHSN
jgi:hypothetical protein